LPPQATNNAVSSNTSSSAPGIRNSTTLPDESPSRNLGQRRHLRTVRDRRAARAVYDVTTPDFSSFNPPASPLLSPRSPVNPPLTTSGTRESTITPPHLAAARHDPSTYGVGASSGHLKL
jgi:hypothetical protein